MKIAKSIIPIVVGVLLSAPAWSAPCAITETSPKNVGEYLWQGLILTPGKVYRLGALSVRVNKKELYSNGYLWFVSVKAPGYEEEWRINSSAAATASVCGRDVSLSTEPHYDKLTGNNDYLIVSIF